MKLIIQNADVREILKINDLLEVISNKTRKLTSEKWKHEFNDKIKKLDLNICTNLKVKLIQLRNFMESCIDMK